MQSSTVLAPPRPGLADLVRQIRQATREGSDPATTAEQVAAALARAQPKASLLLTEEERAGSADHYTRHTLHTEADFSISAVVWRPGQVTEIHDHLVWCSFRVLQGCESETLYRVAGGADGDGGSGSDGGSSGSGGGGGGGGDRLVEVGRRRRPAGSVSGAAPPDDIHRVANTGDAVAITLHVYGADLSHHSSVRRTYASPVGRSHPAPDTYPGGRSGLARH